MVMKIEAVPMTYAAIPYFLTHFHSVIEGLDSQSTDYLYLSRHAYVYTLGDLSRFPQNFPYLFGVLLESGVVPNLEYYVSRAHTLIEIGKKDASQTSTPPTPPIQEKRVPVTPNVIDLETSWLARPRKSASVDHLHVLVKPEYRDLKTITPQSPLSVLATVSAIDCVLLASHPNHPVRSLKDLALLHHDRETLASIVSKVPLIENYILHAQALVLQLA